jgi:hypothetical protein
MPKLDKDTTWKECHRQISSMNIDAKKSQQNISTPNPATYKNSSTP